jgi:hypothetical protein
MIRVMGSGLPKAKGAIYEKGKQAEWHQKASAGKEKVACKICQADESPRRSRAG